MPVFRMFSGILSVLKTGRYNESHGVEHDYRRFT